MKSKLQPKTYLIVASILAILVLIAVFLPYLFIPYTIKNFYETRDQETFVFTSETIEQEDFWQNTDKKLLKFSLFEPKYAVFYKSENYNKIDQVAVVDFFYLERSNILFWEVAKYESAYLPYYESEEHTFDDLYSELQESVSNGEIDKGLTAGEMWNIRDLTPDVETETGDFLDYTKDPTGEKTIEVRAGDKYGENYLIDGETGEKLNIDNVVRGIFSTDGKYYIYTTGSYVEALAALAPNGDLWITDLQSQPKQIFSTPEDLSFVDITFFSDGNTVVYANMQEIGSIKVDGSGKKTLTTLQDLYPGEEHVSLPEFTDLDETNLYLRVTPNFEESPETVEGWRIALDGSSKEKI